MTDEPVVAVPAELELDERLVGAVTFGMASWLAASAAGAVLLGVGGLSAGRLALGLPLVLVGLCGAFWRPGGRAAPSWLGPVSGYLRRRRAERAPRRRPDRRSGSTPGRPRPSTPVRTPRARPGRTSRTVAAAAAAAVLLVVAAFVGGRFTRAHQSGPAPAPPVQAPEAPAPAMPVPLPVVVPAPDDPWSGCGC
ncbi:MAG: hypothetical protein NVSMB55_12980 [Mycobacteriales bacterium]